MTLRMVAGDSFLGSRGESVRLPTGSPVSTYCSTISRRTAAERASRPGGRTTRAGMPGGLRGLSMAVLSILTKARHCGVQRYLPSFSFVAYCDFWQESRYGT